MTRDSTEIGRHTSQKTNLKCHCVTNVTERQLKRLCHTTTFLSDALAAFMKIYLFKKKMRKSSHPLTWLRSCRPTVLPPSFYRSCTSHAGHVLTASYPGLGPMYSVLWYFGTRVLILQYSSVLGTLTFKKYLYSYLYSSTFKNKSTFNEYLRVLYEY